MTLQDQRPAEIGDEAGPAELDSGELAQLEAFLRDSTPVSSNRIPFAFVTGMAMTGLLATTGTVLPVPNDAAEIRYVGERTSTKAVYTQQAPPWVPRPTAAGRPAIDAVAEPVSAAAEPIGAAAVLTGRDVTRLYETSGLTYRQIAGAFGVSERTVHLWAAGNTKPAPRHLERLRTLLDAVLTLDAADATSRRALLLNNRGNQPSIYNTWLRDLAAHRAPVGDVDRLHEPARHS